MNDVIYNAFHFDSLVWDWIIAIYLFLTGLSAGGVILAIYLKNKVIEGPAWQNGIIRAVGIFAPLGIIIGLTILIFHLTRPLTFWKIMIFYNPTSVMSMGVMLFQIYLVFLFIWLAVVFAPLINQWLAGRLAWVSKFITWFARGEKFVEVVLMILAFALAAYTGFLLSALKTYPMLNNPVLPVLFVFSSLSSGAAGCLLFGIMGFKEPTNSPSVKWIHKIETPVVLFELFILIAFFMGLYFGGGQRSVAVISAIGSGFWANWFWIGVIGIGMLLPLALNFFSGEKVKHSRGFIAFVTLCSLLGVLMLRTFILYAGQMTVI